MPGRGSGAWFFPFGLAPETYETVRRQRGEGRALRLGRSLRGDSHDGMEDRHVLRLLRLASTSGIPGDLGGRLAADVMAAGRAAVEVAWRGRSQEEIWLAEAHIVGQVWLGVHLLATAVGLPDEDHADRYRHVEGILCAPSRKDRCLTLRRPRPVDPGPKCVRRAGPPVRRFGE